MAAIIQQLQREDLLVQHEKKGRAAKSAQYPQCHRSLATWVHCIPKIMLDTREQIPAHRKACCRVIVTRYVTFADIFHYQYSPSLCHPLWYIALSEAVI